MNKVLCGLRTRVSRRTSFVAIVGTILASSLAVPLAVNVASASFNDDKAKVQNITGTIDANFKVTATCTTEQSSTGLAKDQLDKDLWHFVVAKETNYDYTRQELNRSGQLVTKTYKGTLSADFTTGGYAELMYKDANTPTKLFAGANNNQADHLYVFTPEGTKITAAWLTYRVVFTAASGDANKATPSGVPTYLTSNHILSHSCPAVDTKPTIVIDSANSSYDATYDQTYRWEVDKELVLTDGKTAKELYFDTGDRPVFTVSATRFPIIEDDKSNWTVPTGSQTISGEFTITKAVRGDVTITSGSATCETSDDNPGDLTFEYTCTFPSTSISSATGTGLNGTDYSVSGSITQNGTTVTSETSTGQWGAPTTPTLGDTFNDTASLVDDLAGFDGEVGDVRSCTGCAEWGIDDNGHLFVDPTDGSFSVTYEMAWDWQDHEDDVEWVDSEGNVVDPDTYEGSDELTPVYCSVDFTNTAVLSVYESAGDTSALSNSPDDDYTSKPSCPPPTVTLEDDITSTYDLNYDETYTWTIVKSMKQDEDYSATYEVKAERSGPDYDEFVVEGATVSGTYTTEFADPSQVTVTVDFQGHEYQCASGAIEESSSRGEYTCAIVDDPITSDDESPVASSTSGLDGQEFFVTAVVDTAGGRSSDDTVVDPESETLASTEEWGLPEDENNNVINESAGIVDDLAGQYGATAVTCVLADDDPCDTNASEGELTQNSETHRNLTTSKYDQGFTLTYTLGWSYLSDPAGCPTITNTASLVDGDGDPMLDDDGNADTLDQPIEAENESEMDCPEPLITLGALTSNYTESWVDTWQWSIDKEKDGAFLNGEKPEYTVTVTKGNAEPSDYEIDDGTQWVSGSFTIEYAEVTGYDTPANGSLADATTTVDLLEGLSGLYDETSCDIDPSTDDDASDGLTYTFTCTVDDESTVLDENGLSTQKFDVEATVEIFDNSDDADGSGDWGDQSADSDERDEKNLTASLLDDLAEKGGTVVSCTILSGADEGEACAASVADDPNVEDDPEVLTAGPYGFDFEVTYTIDWDWRTATAGWTREFPTPAGECDEGVLNTAILYDGDGEILDDLNDDDNSDVVDNSTQCPPPTVKITSVTSSYAMEYDEVYPWTIEKKFVGQDDDWKPMYEVTATRGVSYESSGRVKGGTGTVSGTFTTEFANLSEVEIEIDYPGGPYKCDEKAEVDPNDPDVEILTYSCDVDLQSSDLDDGVNGDEFTVTATAITPGGEDTDTSDVTSEDPETGDTIVTKKTWGTYDAKTESDTPKWETINIVDDLGGYGGTVTSCLGEDPNRVCSATITDVDPGEDVSWELRSIASESTTMFVAYTLDWNYTEEDACSASIENEAKVTSTGVDPSVAPGTTFTDEKRDNAVTTLVTGPKTEETDGLKCPEIKVSVDPSASYSTTYDESYSWILDKSWVSTTASGSAYDITYKVEATRNGPNPDYSTEELVGTPTISGTFTLENASLESVTVDVEDTGSDSCSVSDETSGDDVYDFSCSMSGLTLADVKGASAKTMKVTVSAKENWGSASAEGSPVWTGGAATTNAIDGSAKIVDDLANLGRGSVVSSTASNAGISSGKLTTDLTSGSFVVTYKITGVAACTSPKNTVGLTSSSGKTLSDDVTVDVPCPPVAGLTIGYWGNKAGGTQVIKSVNSGVNPSVILKWPKLSKMTINKPVTTTTTTIDPRTKKTVTTTKTTNVEVPIKDWVSDGDVRQYMTVANCSTDCKTMLLAQALASSMNVEKDARFGTQAVVVNPSMFGGRSCVTVNDLLAEALGSSSESLGTWSTAKRTAYKTIFDDLNNTRATTCRLS